MGLGDPAYVGTGTNKHKGAYRASDGGMIYIAYRMFGTTQTYQKNYYGVSPDSLANAIANMKSEEDAGWVGGYTPTAYQWSGPIEEGFYGATAGQGAIRVDTSAYNGTDITSIKTRVNPYSYAGGGGLKLSAIITSSSSPDSARSWFTSADSASVSGTGMVEITGTFTLDDYLFLVLWWEYDPPEGGESSADPYYMSLSTGSGYLVYVK
jgi:hypothetical protein